MEHTYKDFGRDQRAALECFFTSFMLSRGHSVADQKARRVERLEREGSAPEPEYVAPVKRTASASDNVRRTWTDPSVSVARNTRSGVRVTLDGRTTEHRSTFAAFVDYELPESKHVKFRAELKKAGKLTFMFEGAAHEFEIVSVDV